MTIGIICAIPQELRHLREALDIRATHEVARFRFDVGRLDGQDVTLAGAGVGKANTAVVSTLLATRFEARLLLFSGVAGGLDPALEIGDVVIADRAIQHDAGVLENERVQTYQAGHIPFFNPTRALGYSVRPDLLETVKTALAGLKLPPLSSAAGGAGRPPEIVYGTVLTGDQYLNCEVTRDRLFRELGGRAVEMEGAVLAQVAEAFDLPWLVVRALSDLAAKEAHFDFAAFAEEVAASSALILRRLLPALASPQSQPPQ